MRQLLPFNAATEARENLGPQGAVRLGQNLGSSRPSKKRDKEQKEMGGAQESKKLPDFASRLKQAKGAVKNGDSWAEAENGSAGGATTQGTLNPLVEVKDSGKTGEVMAGENQPLEMAEKREIPSYLVVPLLIQGLNSASDPPWPQTEEVQASSFPTTGMSGQGSLAAKNDNGLLSIEQSRLLVELAGDEVSAVVFSAEAQPALEEAGVALQAPCSSESHSLFPRAEKVQKGGEIAAHQGLKPQGLLGTGEEERDALPDGSDGPFVLSPRDGKERMLMLSGEKIRQPKPIVLPTYQKPEGIKITEIAEKASGEIKGQEIRSEEGLAESTPNFKAEAEGEASALFSPLEKEHISQNSSSVDARFSKVHIKPQDLIFQVVRKARLNVQGRTSQMSIELEPRFLGRLTINLTLHEGNLTARFLADNQEVKNLLEAGLAQLKTALEDSGFRVYKVEVSVDLGNSTAYQGFEQPGYRQEAHPGSYFYGDPWVNPPDDLVISAAEEGQQSWQEGALNILI